MDFKREFNDRLVENEQTVHDWFVSRFEKTPPPFYGSVDLRDAGFKLAPVDHNLYPAGFNNICPKDQRNAGYVLRHQLKLLTFSLADEPKTIAIIPELNTRNKFYLENLSFLAELLQDSGLQVYVTWMGPPPEEATDFPFDLESQSGRPIRFFKANVTDGVFSIENGPDKIRPDAVILNNDFSGGRPEELDSVLEQPILPSHHYGWHSRKKSLYFEEYNALVEDFSTLVGIDPWHLRIRTKEVAGVNFTTSEGADHVAKAVGTLLDELRADYAKHDLQQDPAVFIKSNSGTYGMGIQTVRSAEEVLSWNRRVKNKMSVGKNRSAIESVVIQEGIPTATVISKLPAEPVIYLSGAELIGGFLRTNSKKSDIENLNSQGMVFKKLCMSDLELLMEEDPDLDREPSENPNPLLERVYGCIARLSTLATACETRRMDESRR